MQEYRPVKEGKVREIYDVGEGLIMVATDRISAFDVILKNRITDCLLYTSTICFGRRSHERYDQYGPRLLCEKER